MNNILKYRIVYFIFAGSIFLGCNASQPVKVQNPNVIFILADDMGYGDAGVYGQQLIETPNIDALAQNGIKFTQFYTGTSVCAPSRASFMTGYHTGHTPIRGNKEMKPEGQFPIKAETFTVAELFKNAGYVTGNFGKWGLGNPGSEGEPTKQGFDRFYGYNCQRLAHDYFPDHLWDNTTRVDLPNTLTISKIYAPDLIQKKALEFLTLNKTKPFFTFLSYTLPHAGLELPEGDKLLSYYIRKFNEQARDVKEIKTEPSLYKGQKYPHAAYAAMVTKLDNYVGEVVEKLKELGIAENTLIIFASDNGPHVEGGNDPDFFNSGGGLKGYKRDLYEGGIRTPMIMSWPAIIKAGTTSDHIGAFWDFMPTFADIAKQNSPKNIDGISILPTLLGNNSAQKKHDLLYWEFHENGGRQAVRMGKWKAVKLNAMKDVNSPIELYDLDKDRGEKNNVASSNPEILKKMSELIKSSHIENSDFPFFTKNNN